MTGEVFVRTGTEGVSLTPRLLILHCGKCQENVASKANFRHRTRANSGNPT